MLKYFPFLKVNFSLKYRELDFVLRVKSFRTCKTSAQKRNSCSLWCAELLDEIRAANTFLPFSRSIEIMYLFTLK